MRRSFPSIALMSGLLLGWLSSGLLAADQPPKPKDPPKVAVPKKHLNQPPGPAPTDRLEQRLQAMEHKLDALLAEVRRLRQQQRQRPEGKPSKPDIRTGKRDPGKPPAGAFPGQFGPGKPPAGAFPGPGGPIGHPSAGQGSDAVPRSHD